MIGPAKELGTCAYRLDPQVPTQKPQDVLYSDLFFPFYGCSLWLFNIIETLGGILYVSKTSSRDLSNAAKWPE